MAQFKSSEDKEVDHTSNTSNNIKMGNLCSSWLLQPTFTFGLDPAQISISDVTADVASVAAQVIEFGLQEAGAQEVPGTTCEFTTNYFTLIGLGNSDATANTIQLDIDWNVAQELCGTELSTHAVLKQADYSNFITLFNQFGNANNNQFLSAVTALSYSCPRDGECG